MWSLLRLGRDQQPHPGSHAPSRGWRTRCFRRGSERQCKSHRLARSVEAAGRHSLSPEPPQRRVYREGCAAKGVRRGNATHHSSAWTRARVAMGSSHGLVQGRCLLVCALLFRMADCPPFRKASKMRPGAIHSIKSIKKGQACRRRPIIPAFGFITDDHYCTGVRGSLTAPAVRGAVARTALLRVLTAGWPQRRAPGGGQRARRAAPHAC